MTEPVRITKAELLAQIQANWETLSASLDTLSEAQATEPTDAAGWTAKDHVIHIGAWEDSVYALLTHQPRREYMGIDAETWASGDYDRINEIIRQQYLALSWADVRARCQQIHTRVVAALQGLSDADLYRPASDYQAGSTSDRPIIITITDNTYPHYVEHIPWIEKIVASTLPEPTPTTKAQLLAAMRQHWDDLYAYLDTLSEAQTQATDAGGWTLKDHVIHLAMWENGMNGFLQKLPRPDFMGVNMDTWRTGDVEQINTTMQQQNKDLTWAQVRQKFTQVHEELIGRIEALSEEDMQRPANYYQPTSTATDPLIGRLSGNSYQHYAVQLPWIEALANR